MNARPSRCSARAFSLLELLATIGIIALLAALLLPVLQESRNKARRTRCANNLRQIGIAFNIWAHEHQEKFPMSISTNSRGTAEYAVPGASMVAFRHFQAISNELEETRLLLCPVDQRVAAPFAELQNSNISYGVNIRAVAGNPDSVVVADRNLRTSGRMEFSYLQFGPGDRVEWTSTLHSHRGNVLYGDGHVDVVASTKATTAFTIGGEVALAIPEPDAPTVPAAYLAVPAPAAGAGPASPPAVVIAPAPQLPPGFESPDSGTYTNTNSPPNSVTNPTGPVSVTTSTVIIVNNTVEVPVGRPTPVFAPGDLPAADPDDGPAPARPAIAANQAAALVPAVAAPPIQAIPPEVVPAPANSPAAQSPPKTNKPPPRIQPEGGEEETDGTVVFAQWLGPTAMRYTYLLLLLIVAIAVMLELERRRRNRKRQREAEEPCNDEIGK